MHLLQLQYNILTYFYLFFFSFFLIFFPPKDFLLRIKVINSPGYRARVNRLPIELSISMDLMEKKKFENSDIFVHANMLNYTYISLAQMKDVIVCDEGKEETCTKINIFVGYFWNIDSQTLK